MNVLEKLLFNLQTLASVPKGSRISTAKEFIVIEEDTMLQGIWRRANADSRLRAVGCICREVRTTIAIAYYIMESHYLYIDAAPAQEDANCDIAIPVAKSTNQRDRRINDLKKIKSALLGANRGIDTICQTYDADADVSGHLKPLISEISECVGNITRLLIEIGECHESAPK